MRWLRRTLLLLFVLVVLLAWYALWNFQFRPGRPWRWEEIRPKASTPPLRPQTPRKKRATARHERPQHPRARHFYLFLQGQLVVVEEVVPQKEGKGWKKFRQYYTVEEWSQRLETEPKYRNSYFRLYLFGEEQYQTYLQVSHLLRQFASGRDERGNPYFREVWRF